MAEQYDNTNRFVLFKNDKGDNANRPDYTGTITLEGGKEMSLSAWVRTSAKGVNFMSGQMSEPYKPSEVNITRNAPTETVAAVAEDIPF
tara:strand:+ start:1649 stop:1915 length:267 start_codon:yes stop_codon:yes gene_type:complete